MSAKDTHVLLRPLSLGKSAKYLCYIAFSILKRGTIFFARKESVNPWSCYFDRCISLFKALEVTTKFTFRFIETMVYKEKKFFASIRIT